MAVAVYIPFFGGPKDTLEEGEPVTVPQLRELAVALHAYANEVADLVDKLTEAGWQAQGDGREVRLTHPSFRTERQVKKHLASLGIDSERLFVIDWGPDDAASEPEEGDRRRAASRRR
jgi:hypothetical protein